MLCGSLPAEKNLFLTSVLRVSAVGLEGRQIEDHKDEPSTRAGFQWTVEGSGRGARGKIDAVKREKVTQLQG